MTEPITITHATDADRRDLELLAELDSRHAPAGATLLARVHGELRAAVGIADGSAVADPFHPTAEIVSLLRAAARQEGSLRRAA